MASILRRGLPQVLRYTRPSAAVWTSCARKNVPIIFMSPRLVSSSSKKDATSASAGTLSATEKSAFEIELERLKKDKPVGYGYVEDPFLDKALFHGLFFLMYSCFMIFGLSIVAFMPYFRGNDRKWKFREAHMLIAERRAKGEPLINPDYAPAELIESMVPPPGEWEKDWLEKQPTTRPTASSWWSHFKEY